MSNIEIRPFIQRFNGSSGGIPYGFWVFRAFSAWFSGWFGEMGYGWGAGLEVAWGSCGWLAGEGWARCWATARAAASAFLWESTAAIACSVLPPVFAPCSYYLPPSATIWRPNSPPAPIVHQCPIRMSLQSPASPPDHAGSGRACPATHHQPGGWRAQGAHPNKSDVLKDSGYR